jgi:hypothetical protein
MSQASSAHKLLDAGQSLGKILLMPDEAAAADIG